MFWIINKPGSRLTILEMKAAETGEEDKEHKRNGILPPRKNGVQKA